MDLTINNKIIFKAQENLPEDATIEDAQYRLHVLEQVSKSLANTGEKIPQEEIEKEFLSENE
jgi:hypothetical protein